MSPEVDSVITQLAMWILVVHTLGLLISLYRIFWGPDLSNRLIGLEYVGLNALSFIAVFCIVAGDTVYLDVGIVLALITFLSTLSLGRYIERGAKNL